VNSNTPPTDRPTQLLSTIAQHQLVDSSLPVLAYCWLPAGSASAYSSLRRLNPSPACDVLTLRQPASSLRVAVTSSILACADALLFHRGLATSLPSALPIVAAPGPVGVSPPLPLYLPFRVNGSAVRRRPPSTERGLGMNSK
jgi:hypothetical protein